MCVYVCSVLCMYTCYILTQWICAYFVCCKRTNNFLFLIVFFFSGPADYHCVRISGKQKIRKSAFKENFDVEIVCITIDFFLLSLPPFPIPFPFFFRKKNKTVLSKVLKKPRMFAKWEFFTCITFRNQVTSWLLIYIQLLQYINKYAGWNFTYTCDFVSPLHFIISVYSCGIVYKLAF